jgi:UDP-glucose 4-epimerase
VKALNAMSKQSGGVRIYNLGTGIGYSVLDVIGAFEEANDLKIPYTIMDRRAGDIPTCYADPSKAEKELGWKAERGIIEMCRDSWNWQKNNPGGFEE